MLKEDGTEQKRLSAEELFLLLRGRARLAAEGGVYRSRSAEALFVSPHPPCEQELFNISEKDGRFLWVLSGQGLRCAEALCGEADLSLCPGIREVCRDETDAVLYTQARLCLERGGDAPYPYRAELLQTVLYHLSAGEREKETLASRLSALTAEGLRKHIPLSRAAGTLIMRYLEQKRDKD